MPKLSDTLVILPYDSNWNTEFERIRDYLMEQIGDLVIEIKHIGSTSVPGLCAKPIIDIVAIMESYKVFPQIVSRLEKVGFQHVGDQGIKEREVFKRLIPDDFMDYHFYICPKDSKENRRHTRFRNALIRNPQIAEEYGKLKTRLISEVNGDRVLYTDSKTDFILDVMNRVNDDGELAPSQNTFDRPFWEIGYSDKSVSTFQKGATKDVTAFYQNLAPHSHILDVGCGEGRNSIFLAEQGHAVDAFDISEAGIEKAKYIAAQKSLDINFFVCDLGEYIFDKEYDVILSHGVLHLPEKDTRDRFIQSAQAHTKPGGYNIIGIFTNRLPATPDNAPFTKSLFDVGELPGKYERWDILSHEESTFKDSHPGGVSHEHAYERIIAKKPY